MADGPRILMVQVLPPEPSELHNKRMFFLRTAADHPRIKLWDSLRRMVLGPLDAFWRKLGLPVPNVPQWTDVQDSKLDEFYKERDRLIHKWAHKHNLDFEWVRIAAMDEFTTYQADRKLSPLRFIQLPGSCRKEPPHWEWWRESELEYRKRRRAHCNREADAYISALNQARTPPKGVTTRHYRWAAERVCLGWTLGKIAMSEYNDRDNDRGYTVAAVSKAVPQILQELQITAQRG